MNILPAIAIVGRPNVGKSTLFNRLTKTRDALVANIPGLTRDRQYGEASFDERRFIVIDTGGVGEENNVIEEKMSSQSQHAMCEADCIFFMVDAKAGLTSSDERIAAEIRALGQGAISVTRALRDPVTGLCEKRLFK